MQRCISSWIIPFNHVAFCLVAISEPLGNWNFHSQVLSLPGAKVP